MKRRRYPTTSLPTNVIRHTIVTDPAYSRLPLGTARNLRVFSMNRIRALLALSLLLCAGGLSPAWAQATLLDVVQTLATPSVAVPKEGTFTITTAGDYNLTLTDLGARAFNSPLASVEVAVTGSDVLVGTPLVG